MTLYTYRPGDGKILHMCISVRGLLKQGKRDFARTARAMTKADGTTPTPDEARDLLLDELAKGHEVLPLGDPCEGFDFKTGCPGHDAEEVRP